MPEKVTEVIPGGYSVKGMKTVRARAREGEAWECSIYHGNRKIGYANNEGVGGPTTAVFKSPKYESELKAFCKLHPDLHIDDMSLKMDIEFFIDLLVGDYLEQKEYKRATKNGRQTCFRLKGDAENIYNVINAPYDTRMQKALADEYGDALIEVLNTKLKDFDRKKLIVFREIAHAN